jgi:hypothetical protein
MSNVKTSSVHSHTAYGASGQRKIKRDEIRRYLAKNGWATRLMIATDLKIATATVSGLITPMLEGEGSGEIEESPEKSECPYSPRKTAVHWIRLKPGQIGLFK